MSNLVISLHFSRDDSVNKKLGVFVSWWFKEKSVFN